ncbi:alpha/beta hydrolase family protein [Aquihabitans sp. McL0605]|uniref:alpha/beta hydrolase family protein n=1 Tax=Aquihabitans sp. McL0605 TaxID=3415671 RepID=UPI003CE68634
MLTTRRALACSLLVLAGLLAACSSGDSDTSTTGAKGTTTTATAAADAANRAYVEEGPNPVGTYTIALDDGRRVVIWYPAAAGAADLPKETFDIASLLSPALQAKISADLRPQYEINAHPGADPATDGPYPVVVFSHGYAGFPEQSADLVTHLASWGFVVIAPDHVERSLDGLLGTAAQGVTPRKDPEVLSASLDAAIADAKSSSSPLNGLLDLDEVAVAGHSAGAGAAYLAASSDKRFKAFISYSVGTGQGADGKAVERPVPTIPGMVMLGTKDGIIPPAASKTVYEGMNPPKYLVQIADAGHLVFSDICLIGRDKGGLVALVKAAGLDLGEQLLRLANDGCQKDHLDPAKAFPAIDQFSVAFLRSALGIDPEPVGLNQATADTFKTADVTITGDTGN